MTRLSTSRRLMSIATAVYFLAVLSACSGVLPRAKETNTSPWKSFEESKLAYEKIVPYRTTVAQLEDIGYSPYRTPNIKILTYLEIMQAFMPNESVSLDDLPDGVKSCILAKQACHGYRAMPSHLDSERTGSVLLDLFTFKRVTEKTGWAFEALIVIQNKLVVYKLWGGSPKIHTRTSKRKPLGPLQDSGDLLRKVVQ